SRIGTALAGSPVPQQAIDVAKESVGGAEVVAQQAGQQAGPQAESMIHTAINKSFGDGWHAGSWVCFGVLLLGALVARKVLAARSGQDPVAVTLGDPVTDEVREAALV